MNEVLNIDNQLNTQTLFEQCFSDENTAHTPTLSDFDNFVRVLGDVTKFFDKPVVLFGRNKTSLADFLTEKPAFDAKNLYCFYKEFAIFFDDKGKVAYHFNRTQQQMFVLGRGGVVNRYKNALKREQEAIGKTGAFENNAAWRMYWELAQNIIS